MSHFPNPLAVNNIQYDAPIDLGVKPGSSKLDRRLLLFLGIPQVLMLAGLAASGLSGGTLGVVQIFLLLPSLAVAVAYPFYGIAMLFLIFPFDELLELGGGGGQFTISKLMAILTTIGYVIRTTGGRYSLFPTEKVGKAAATLAAIILLSSIWSESPVGTLLRGLSPILLAVLVCYGAQLIDTRERWETVLTALILSGLFAAGMMSLGVGSVEVLGGSQERVFLGAGVNPNHTSVVMAVSAYMCFALLFVGQSRLMRAVAIAALPILGIAILLTKSRASAIALPFGICMGIFLGLRQNLGVKLIAIVLIIALGLGAFFFAGSIGLIDIDTIFSRWESLGSAAGTREHIRKVGWSMWQGAPFIGHGFGMYDLIYTRYASASSEFGGGLARDPHNLWIKMVAELGTVGLIAMLWLISVMWVAAFQTKQGAGRFLIIAILSCIGAVTLSSSVITYKYSWYSIMVIAATAKLFPARVEESPEFDGIGGFSNPVKY